MKRSRTFEETARFYPVRHLFGNWYIMRNHSYEGKEVSYWKLVNKKWFKPAIEPEKTEFAFAPSYISYLIKSSSYVSEHCTNEIETLKNGNIVWFHHLPMLDYNEPAMSPSNWNISPDDAAKVQATHADLIEYIMKIVKLHKHQSPVRNHLNDIVDFLPPWIAFPLYSENDIGWLAGGGKLYLQVFQAFLDTLSKDEFDSYMQAYHAPFWYQHWDIKRSQDMD